MITIRGVIGGSNGETAAILGEEIEILIGISGDCSEAMTTAVVGEKRSIPGSGKRLPPVAVHVGGDDSSSDQQNKHETAEENRIRSYD